LSRDRGVLLAAAPRATPRQLETTVHIRNYRSNFETTCHIRN
jgi:hypothetical protein